MKKWLLILGMLTGLIGLTACGSKEEPIPLMTQDIAEEYGAQTVEMLNMYIVQNAQDQAASSELLSKALNSFEKALEEIGSYQGIVKTEYECDDQDGTIDVTVIGSKERTAVVEIVIKKGMITDVTTNVNYSFGEKMEKAALNTLIGMGTVFVVLVLISFLISCFKYIGMLQDKFSGKTSKEAVKSAAVDHTIAQIREKEELADNLELVAVIAAAIAASEGAASADGFVVRSITRARRPRA